MSDIQVFVSNRFNYYSFVSLGRVVLSKTLIFFVHITVPCFINLGEFIALPNGPRGSYVK